MLILMIVLCCIAILLNVAVLRDQTIPERDIVESLRLLKISAHIVSVLTGGYLAWTGYWLQAPLAIAVIGHAVVDIVAAGLRLFPHVIERNGSA